MKTKRLKKENEICSTELVTIPYNFAGRAIQENFPPAHSTIQRRPLSNITNNQENSNSFLQSPVNNLPHSPMEINYVDKQQIPRKKSHACHKKENRAPGCVRVFPIGNPGLDSVLIKAYFKCEIHPALNRKKLEKITTIVYDDIHHDIYIGNEAGAIMKWSSKF